MSTQPTPADDDLDDLLGNINAAPGNDEEIEALKDIIITLWQELEDTHARVAIANLSSLRAKAQRWADGQYE